MLKNFFYPLASIFMMCSFANSGDIDSIKKNNMIIESWEDPEAKFDATVRNVTFSTIQWVLVKDIQGVCNTESKKRGLGGFNFQVDACSFWNGPNCIIYTRESTTLHELEHEMRHSFQGNYH